MAASSPLLLHVGHYCNCTNTLWNTEAHSQMDDMLHHWWRGMSEGPSICGGEPLLEALYCMSDMRGDLYVPWVTLLWNVLDEGQVIDRACSDHGS